MVNLTSNGSYNNFVQKMDANGNFLWAKAFGNTSAVWAEGNFSIAVDVLGNVYTTGGFVGTADFNPGAGTANLVSKGGNANPDVFVQKMDANGNFLWAKSFGGISADYGYAVALDVSGNVYTTGWFAGTADFDPGSGVFNLTSIGGTYDVFVQKMDASGNFLWAKSFGGNSIDRGCSITTDGSGNVYTTGNFYNAADFDPGSGTTNLTSNGEHDIFIQKMDANGNFLWAKSFGGASSDYGYSIVTDDIGNSYTTGEFAGTADFNPGAGTLNLTSNGGLDIFIQKLDANGNFLWAKSFGGTSNDRSNAVAADVLGNIYTTGYYKNTVDFDPGAGTANLTSNGGLDIFIQKMDGSGNFLWAKSFGETLDDAGSSIAVDASENIYTAGGFGGTVDFNPGQDVFNLTSVGQADIFVQKMSSATSCLNTTSNIFPKVCNSYTSPSGNHTWTTNGTYKDTILNQVGCDSVITINLTVKRSTTSNISRTVCNSYISPSGNHTWTTNGTYKDTISNQAGCDSVITINLTVHSGSKAGIISAVRDTICAGTPINISTTGSEGIIQWQSSLNSSGGFTDITSADDTLLIDIPAQTMYYRVYANSSGCADSSAPYKVIVNPSPVASFTTSISGLTVNFNASASTGAIVYEWDFGDGVTSNDSMPSHNYTKDSIFSACLTVYNGSNCSFTVCKDIALITGITNHSVSDALRVYPVPFDNHLYISWGNNTDKIKEVAIFDLSGRKVLDKRFSIGESNILEANVSGLPQGMYILRIEVDTTVTIQPVLRIIKLQ